MKEIRNIVFDFGGVLLDIDYRRTYRSMSKILNFDFQPDHLTEKMIEILNDFEKGVATKETFLWNIQRLTTKAVPHGKDIINAWNAMLIGWDESKFDLLLSLRKNYKVFLLSNTNEVHLDWVYHDLKKNHNIEDFDARFFDKTYYSHLVGMRKPDREIYQFVEKDAGILPEHTIFIDDIQKNIDGAKSVGWNTYLHNPSDGLSEVLCNKLKLVF